MGALSYIASASWSSLVGYLALLFVSYKLIQYTQRLFFHPLSKFPGPKICAASRLYEFYWDSLQHGRLWTQLPALHDKYGPIVRMGPDELHIRDPEYFTYIFSFKPLDKWAIAARQFGLRSAMFGTEEHKHWAQRRAAFGDSFSRTKTYKLQPLVNEKIEKGCSQVRDRASKGESMDLAYLYRAITAEIITEYMYGEQYGFFEDEMTTKGLYDRRFDSIFGMINLGRFIPFWIPIVCIMVRGKISALLGSKEPSASVMTFLGFAEKMLKQQTDEHGIQQEPSEDKDYKTAVSAYLHSNLPLADKTGSGITQATMAAWAGGWDTTAFALTLASYQILENASVTKKLQTELQAAWPDQKQNPSVEMLTDLPYLNAVSHESLRLMHGALCRLTRFNPTGPEQYKSWTIPAGTKISMSTSDIHLDPAIWGSDAEIFRPERWLPGEMGNFQGMEKWLVSFGRGTRVCAGVELAYMELKFILGTLFRRFDMVIEAGVSDADVLPWSDGFTPGPKNMIQWLPVTAKESEL